ncbi:MAG: tetratricopeptide repeat protein [Candidatus Obscuribacterales bacterium]
MPDNLPSTLRARLEEAEKSYRDGKIDAAVEQATKLVGVKSGGILGSDENSREAMADLAVFQIKAGHPDESARLIRVLLLAMQLELPMAPGYESDPAGLYAESPKMMKEYFGKVLARLGERDPGDTRAIIDSLIDNTVPRDYEEQLEAYCKSMKEALGPVAEFRSIADGEQLRYGDPLTSLTDDGSDSAGDGKGPSAAKLDKLGSTLQELAEKARAMPVADVRPALALYQLALVANGSRHFDKGEKFAGEAIQSLDSLTEDSPAAPDFQIALAYALIKQAKIDDFRALREKVLKNGAVNERHIVTMARLTDLAGDTAGALQIYKTALDRRTKSGQTQDPDWLSSYNELAQREGQRVEPARQEELDQKE